MSQDDLLGSPIWIECPMCGEPFCVLHQMHAADCSCQGIDTWAEHDLSPYVTTVGDLLSLSAMQCLGR